MFADRVRAPTSKRSSTREVYRRINEWLAARRSRTTDSRSPTSRCCIETGHDHDYDKVIVVRLRPAEQFRRLMARDGLSADAASARLAAQWPIGEKVSRANYVIRTDGDFHETSEQVQKVYDNLAALYASASSFFAGAIRSSTKLSHS